MDFHPHTPQDQLAHDADLLIEPFLPSSDIPHEPSAGIPQPFCLPQIAGSFDSPFARGYNPVLQACVGISQDQLLAFIDGLNLAMTASPPLRVVDLAGLVIGFIPHDWAMIGGGLLQIGAEGGTRILNKSVTDRYLRTANLRLFKPRGLVVRICTSTAMRHLVLGNGNEAGLSTMKKLGRGLGTVLLQAPIPYTSRIVRAIADKPPKVQAVGGVGDIHTVPLSTQRRVAVLEGHALPVQFDVPPPAKAQGLKDKMGSWGIAFDSWVTKKRETKVEQRRHRLVRVEEQLRQLGINPHGRRQEHIGGPSGHPGPSRYEGQPRYAAPQGYDGQHQYHAGPSHYGGQPPSGYPGQSPYAGHPQYAVPQEYTGQHQYDAGPSHYSGDRPPEYGDLYAADHHPADTKNPSGYPHVPQGYGAPQEYGALQGYAAPQEYSVPQGYPGPFGHGGQPHMPHTDRKERKDIKKAVRRAQKRERGPGLIDTLIGPKETKLERKVADADLLEHWASDKVLWVVIMNAEMDQEIEGIERAENMNDEEHIDEKTWQEEMSKERNVLKEGKGHESDGDDEYYR